jgi:hypothetical protein
VDETHGTVHQFGKFMVKQQNVALPMNAFVLYFAICDYCAGGGNQLLLSTVLGYVKTVDLLQYLMSPNLNFSLSDVYCSNWIA